MSIENLITTITVEKELPLYLRNMLWHILEYAREYHDELHCFELEVTANENGKTMQKIVHMYKIPVYQKEHLYPDEALIKASVVIKIEGSDAQIIMMFADELKMKTRND